MEAEDKCKEIGLWKFQTPLNENFMFTFHPCSEHFDAVIVARNLWQSPDMRIELARYVLLYKKHSLDDRKYYSSQMLEKLRPKLEELEQVETLRNRVFNFIQPIGHEIVKNYFKIFHRLAPHVNVYIDRLCWTPWGTVDIQKTVQSYLVDGNFPVIDRYLTACRFCCSEYDVKLWNRLTTEMKDFVNTEAEIPNSKINFVFIGTCCSRRSDLKGLSAILGEPLEDELFRPCVTHDVLNETDGRKFQEFWVNLNSKTKTGVLEKIAELCISKPICNPEVVVFLVSQMNSEQRMGFYRFHADFMIYHILNDWTKHELFMKSVKLLGSYISIEYYQCILHQIAKRSIEDLGHIADSRSWFEKLWIWSPERLKRQIFGDYPCIIEFFVTSMDAQSIKLMLKDANEEEKQEIFNWVDEKMLSFNSMTKWNSFKKLVGQIWFDED